MNKCSRCNEFYDEEEVKFYSWSHRYCSVECFLNKTFTKEEDKVEVEDCLEFHYDLIMEERIAVHCKTYEEANELLKWADSIQNVIGEQVSYSKIGNVYQSIHSKNRE